MNLINKTCAVDKNQGRDPFICQRVPKFESEHWARGGTFELRPQSLRISVHPRSLCLARRSSSTSSTRHDLQPAYSPKVVQARVSYYGATGERLRVSRRAGRLEDEVVLGRIRDKNCMFWQDSESTMLAAHSVNSSNM
ncbi:hypothetical protein PM082_016805 [Marasmius tenuissimus]|nr:hypothetical protein PM082_016805 [Marasmius tenuissimus]